MNANAVASVIAICLLLTCLSCGMLLIVGFNDPCLGFEPPICNPTPIIVIVWLPTDTPAATPTAAPYPTITPDGLQYRWMIPTPGDGQAPAPQHMVRPQYCNARDCVPTAGTPTCTLVGQQWFCK